MTEKKEPNGILFESDTHVMIEVDVEGSDGNEKQRITIAKSSIRLGEYPWPYAHQYGGSGVLYAIYIDRKEFIINKKTYYALCNMIFGDGVEARLKLFESAGIVSKLKAKSQQCTNQGTTAQMSSSPFGGVIQYNPYNFSSYSSISSSPSASASSSSGTNMATVKVNNPPHFTKQTLGQKIKKAFKKR